jgi:TP901 family phage tail tape measure protein
MPTVRELVNKITFDVNSSQLRASDRMIDQNKAKIRSLGKQWNTFRTDSINKLGKGLSGVQSRFSGLNSRLETQFAGVLKPMRALGKEIPLIGGALSSVTAGALAVAGGVAAIALAIKGLKNATEAFKEFESGMKSVQRVTLASTEDMKRLEDAALAAASSSIFTTKQAAEAEKFLAMAGLDVNEVIAALPGTLQLAAAAELDLGTAADISTNILSSNQLQVEELTHVNDVLAKTANSTNTDVRQLGEAFATLGNTGKLAGVDIEQLSSLFGILANNGIRGSLAGTLVRNALQDISAPTAKVKGELADIGINIEKFTDESGKLTGTGLLDFFGELGTAIDENRIKGTELANVFGERSGRAIATFAATSREELEKTFDAIANNAGTAAKASEVAFQGLTGSLAEFNSKM